MPVSPSQQIVTSNWSEVKITLNRLAKGLSYLTEKDCDWLLKEADKLRFRRHLRAAAEEVKSWPLWKQRILEDSGKPFVDIPRKPVCNTED